MESPTNAIKPVISMLLVEDDKETMEILATILPTKFPDVTLPYSQQRQNGFRALQNTPA